MFLANWLAIVTDGLIWVWSTWWLLRTSHLFSASFFFFFFIARICNLGAERMGLPQEPK